MSDLIQSQIFHTIIMCCSGMVFMIIWEVASWCSRNLKFSRFSKALLELVIWILQGFITSAFLYYCAYGQISFHSLCSFVIGAILWKKIFYGIIYDTLILFKNVIRG